MTESGLMPYEADRRLVAGGIYLDRLDRALEELPRSAVYPERHDQLDLCLRLTNELKYALDELRTGRKRNKFPMRLADVADLDKYREQLARFATETIFALSAALRRKRR